MTVKCNTDKQLSLISLEILEITLNSRNSLLIKLECVPTKGTPVFKRPFLDLLSLISKHCLVDFYLFSLDFLSESSIGH